jgi:hypothetical protein
MAPKHLQYVYPRCPKTVAYEVEGDKAATVVDLAAFSAMIRNTQMGKAKRGPEPRISFEICSDYQLASVWVDFRAEHRELLERVQSDLTSEFGQGEARRMLAAIVDADDASDWLSSFVRQAADCTTNEGYAHVKWLALACYREFMGHSIQRMRYGFAVGAQGRENALLLAELAQGYLNRIKKA